MNSQTVSLLIKMSVKISTGLHVVQKSYIRTLLIRFTDQLTTCGLHTSSQNVTRLELTKSNLITQTITRTTKLC